MRGSRDILCNRTKETQMSTSKKVTRTLIAAIAVAFVSLAGSAQAETTGADQYQPVSPSGWEIPAPGTPGRLILRHHH
ncbi:MAG: hypothetical protein MZW92_68200 [Comamonadaceae bacterium]|nr:hypothetical protein [Comamonadaceae bacterium]